MKVLIKKSFDNYPAGHIIEIDENNEYFYGALIYWLRRCEEGKIDGFCELLEFKKQKTEKVTNMLKLNKGKRKNTKNIL